MVYRARKSEIERQIVTQREENGEMQIVSERERKRRKTYIYIERAERHSLERERGSVK